MFDLLASGMQAYNQVGMLLGALICLGIGGLILGNSLYWRVHALRASGTIIGVISNAATYVPVYRYTLPDGETHVAKSDTGSSSTSGKQTGRVVSLLISAHDPNEAREAGSYVLELIGAVFVAPGLFLGYVGLTAYPVTRMTWIVGLAMLIYLVERGRRIFVPKGQRLSIAEWKKQYEEASGTSPAVDLRQVKPIEQLVSPSEVAEAQQRQRQGFKKAAPFMALFAVILVSLGIIQSFDVARLQSRGVRAPGEIVGLKQESGSGGQYSYHPIVRFRTDRNARVQFTDSFGSNPPVYRAGDKVTVLYLAESPQRNAMIDRGLLLNWAIPALLFAFAALLVGIMLAVLRNKASEKSRGPVDALLSNPSQSQA
jgi:hypothetical protein